AVEFALVARRSYGQLCPIAHALDLVGERWTLLVVRELVLGPKRFTDLQDSLPGIGTNILSARLKQLEQIGVLQRRRLAPPPAPPPPPLPGSTSSPTADATSPTSCSGSAAGASARPPSPTSTHQHGPNGASSP